MPNWSRAKKQFERIVSRNGVWIYHLTRTTSGSGAYDTDDTTTYGYGDETVYWTTGSVKAIIEPIRQTDVVIEPGFYQEDYRKIYVDPDEDLEHWDQVIYPTGSGIRYLILPVTEWNLTGENTTVCKTAIIRRLVPKSRSEY